MIRSLTDELEHLSGCSVRRSMPICSLCSSRAESKQQLAPPFPLSRGKYSNHPTSRNIGWWAPAPDACPRRRPEAKESPVDVKSASGPGGWGDGRASPTRAPMRSSSTPARLHREAPTQSPQTPLAFSRHRPDSPRARAAPPPNGQRRQPGGIGASAAWRARGQVQPRLTAHRPPAAARHVHARPRCGCSPTFSPSRPASAPR